MSAMTRLDQLSGLGQSVWIDFLSRDLLESGDLARAIDEDAVVGVTSNPTILEKALAHGEAYDTQIRDAADVDTKSLFLDLVMRDVTDACDLLRPVWERTGAADGYVSIEVDPNLAADTEATIEEAAMFHAAIARPNLLVKIPATDAGVPAIEEMTARGRSINVTLIFSLTRHQQVIEAYLRGLERFVGVGGDPSAVHSVASFFVSRVDSETDRRLDELGREDLKGRLGIANARLAYQQYKHAFSGDRWERLAAHGATKQRCLWASTSTKDPELPRHALRRGVARPGDDLDDARRDDPGLPGSRAGRAATGDRCRRGAVVARRPVRRGRRLRRRRRPTRA